MSNQVDKNPKTRVGGASKLPMHLIPERALAHVAMAFCDGATKYQGFNWHAEQISSSVYYGAARRHMMAWWCGEDVSPDSNVHHLASAAACLLMVLDTMDTQLLNDNRPPAIGESFSELAEKLSESIPVLADRAESRYDIHDLATQDD